MKILLTGGTGQLGQELLKLGDFIAPDRKEMDILSESRIKITRDRYNPDIIIHAAAYTNTFLPEKDPIEAYHCYQTNIIGTRNVVMTFKCPIIFISTETCLNPYNFYAITKFQSENEIKLYSDKYKIIRTSFRERPFEYDLAFDDMYTIGDYVDVIAKLINKEINKPIENNIVYVGTGVKTPYDLAIKTKPNVKKVSYKIFKISPMEELLTI